MTEPLLWILIAIQIGFGAFDTVFHHEFTERLPWRLSQKNELRLHGVRNAFYALVFIVIGWTMPQGAFAALLLVVLAAEVVITLWDFVEEDRSRRLPPSERVLHTLMALNYGAILALMAPVLFNWASAPTGLGFAYYGVYSWFCMVGALGAALFGARDIAAAKRLARFTSRPAEELSTCLTEQKSILITGGTGFVGSRLVQALVAGGHKVTVLTRDTKHAMEVLPTPIRLINSLDHLSNNEIVDAIIHLAGEPISNGLWTRAKKAKVIDSRVKMTNSLLALVERLETRPECFVSASAVGWYGLRDATPLMETHVAEVNNFSHQSCEAFERAARKMERQNVRTVRLRIGLVLDRDGGLLARMLTPFEFGLGGPFGNGRQMMSWITRDDLIRLISHVLATPTLSGAVNATAPGAVTNAGFTEALGSALNRPAIFRVPAAALRFGLGQFAHELLLSGQNVKPDKAQATGFEFLDAELGAALKRIVAAEAPNLQTRRGSADTPVAVPAE